MKTKFSTFDLGCELAELQVHFLPHKLVYSWVISASVAKYLNITI